MRVVLIFFAGGVYHQKNILALFLHQVLLAGELFKCRGIGLQLSGEDRIPADLVEVELFLDLQLLQLRLQVLLHHDVVAVEKDEPYDERNGREEVLVEDDVEDLFQHGSRSEDSIGKINSFCGIFVLKSD